MEQANPFRRLAKALAGLCTGLVLAVAPPAGAADTPKLGITVLPAQGEDEPVTLYYPSSSPAAPVQHGFYRLNAAPDGAPLRGNGHLVLISHGTGGSGMVHTDLARTLVAAGFTVATPLHRGDNWRDHRVGTFDSPKIRPQEVSRAIDAVARDPRFSPLLDFQRVGVYGMSAGGFTALTLAGGRWSPQQFVKHCDANLAEDWHFCTGVFTALNGGWLDGFKQWVARKEIHRRFDADTASYTHTDPRVAAVVAAVPAAAAFELPSLAQPKVPLGLVTMGADRWLKPRFHGEAVLATCAACERLATLDNGGHGVMLSPSPPGLSGVLGDMLNDPPGFDRAVLPAIDQRIADFFSRRLLN
ncbi:putative dienelactone hydrolase [Burkholderiales bacterium JOSHI_001]|nr:putative dienelactone hydrolase [Burkholderiales bacterium JOSHI_001]